MFGLCRGHQPSISVKRGTPPTGGSSVKSPHLSPDHSEAVRRLSLREGDIIIVGVRGVVSDEHARRVRTMIGDVAPGHNVLILSDGMNISILGTDLPGA
ncbi:MAG TPA: hypothetical protein VNQ99_08735 [Xanthobacteraceae bacterium]|nr:hypothetical protein [Xanthobacteraceae bacterium]